MARGDARLQFARDQRGNVCVTGSGADLVRAGRRHPITASPVVVLPGDAVEHEDVRLRLVLEPQRPPVLARRNSRCAALALAGLLGLTSPAWAGGPAAASPAATTRRGKRHVPPPPPPAGAVKGKVGRAEIAIRISGRTVLMDPGTLRERSVTTDDKGQFSFDEVRPGVHLLRVSVGSGERASDSRVKVSPGKIESAWLQIRPNTIVHWMGGMGMGATPEHLRR